MNVSNNIKELDLKKKFIQMCNSKGGLLVENGKTLICELPKKVLEYNEDEKKIRVMPLESKEYEADEETLKKVFEED